jgi:hypothetical protein
MLNTEKTYYLPLYIFYRGKKKKSFFLGITACPQVWTSGGSDTK